jgi:hypothetical protein
MNFIKFFLPLIIILAAITACSDSDQQSKTKAKVNSELNLAGEDLKNAVEHTKKAALSAVNDIKEEAVEAAENAKQIVEDTTLEAQQAALDIANSASQQLQKAKVYSTEAIINTTSKIEETTRSQTDTSNN